MERRKLGNSGLNIAPLVLGGNVFGWTVDEAKSFALLDGFVDAGLNCIDTADVYSTWAPGHKGGESETIIGNWLKRSGKRDRVIIATKVGMEMPQGKRGLSKAYITQAVEDSLRRLQTDYIDLYQSHKDDPTTPLDETMSAFAELMKQGKVRAIGASNYSGERLEEALKASSDKGFPRYEVLQPHYNLMERAEYETTIEPVVQKEGIGVIPYYSLAAGFLTGKYRSVNDLKQSPRGAGAKKYLNERGLKVLQALDDVAAKHNSKPARVALAWLIARPSVTAPIASATSLEQLSELVEATRLKLDAESIESLNKASS